MTYRLLRFFCACGAGGSLLGLLLGAVVRAVVPGGVLPWVVLSTAGVLLAALWTRLCWWWLVVRS